MKRLRMLCILLVSLPLFILMILGIREVLLPSHYESTAGLILHRKVGRFGSVGKVDLLEMEDLYDCVSSVDLDGERLEFFVMSDSIDGTRLLEFCRIMEESVPNALKYRAYFFDDADFAKSQAESMSGVELDENGRARLKAAYVRKELTIIDSSQSGGPAHP